LQVAGEIVDPGGMLEGFYGDKSGETARSDHNPPSDEPVLGFVFMV
jgi:hypothetical protein